MKNLLKKILITMAAAFYLQPVLAQDTLKGITLEEYRKAASFTVKDLDNETYLKFDNNRYIVERYEDKKPYYITGDDGNRKRIDLYTLTRKGQDLAIGTIIYYTTEKGKRYQACLPAAASAGKVWETYFEDIHAIDKQETFFVLKLSYVLSKEFSYQQYRSSLKGAAPDRAEAATYGNDICFPGTDIVTMADGTSKPLSSIVPGDRILSADEVSVSPHATLVKNIIRHAPKNYAITSLLMVQFSAKKDAHDLYLSVQELKATPNHPMTTQQGATTIGAVTVGDRIRCLNKRSGLYENFIVWDKQEAASGVQPVYSLEAANDELLIMNGVLTRQK